MATLAQIRTALKDTISSGVSSELFVYDTVPDLSNLPAVIVEPASADFTETFSRGTDCWDFHVFVLCSRGADTSTGQEQLDGFVTGGGADSIRQALFNKSDLGLGDGTDSAVMALRGYGGSFDTAKIPLVGAILLVRVYTDGRST